MADEENWYCIKTRPRHEQAVKLALRTDAGVEVFCPLLRFERARASGKVRVVEAMFPGYVFSRFRYLDLYRQVRSCSGVSTIVAFGGVPAVVPEAVISQLRAAVSDGETVEIPTQVKPGEEVQIVEGAMKGLRAVVTRVMPSRDRVTVLLEMLGMEREVDLAQHAVLPDVVHPMAPR